MVTEIVAPWGPGIDERPRVLSEVERVEIRRRKREGKVERRRGRREGEVEGMGEGGSGDEGTRVREEVGERG